MELDERQLRKECVQSLPFHRQVNPAKKETPHSFKGQQLETKLLYRFVIYIVLWVKFLALI